MESELRMLVELENQLSSAQSFAVIGDLVMRAIKNFGFEKYFYAVWDSNQPFSNFDVELGEYPESFANDKDSCICNTEPVIRYCMDNTVPLIWDGKRIHQIKADSIEKPLEKYRNDYQLRNIPAGVLVPLHKVHEEIGFVYVWSEGRCSKERLVEIKQTQALVLVLSIYLHNAVSRVKESNSGCGFVKLTKREIQCLQSCHAGKSYKEISASLGISERTVVFHVTNLFKKLGVNNKAQAVKKAQALKIMKTYPTSTI